MIVGNNTTRLSHIGLNKVSFSKVGYIAFEKLCIGLNFAGTKFLSSIFVALLGLCRLFILIDKVSFGKVWQDRL